MVRLVAWNCCGGPLERKLAALETLAPDIAVIPECPRLPPSRGRIFWIGSNPRKGLGVVARPPWRIYRATSRRDLPSYIYPLRVSGPESFLLWAVWACNIGADRYVRGMHRAVDSSRRLFRSAPSVMLGDFNSNSIWDHEHPPDRSHSALVQKLAALGLASSYHALHGEPHGAESRPTFFEYRHAHRPYHIDYCFLPASWSSRIAGVALGSHAEWAQQSDHMPIIVDLAPAAV
ncbi:MAG: endonuclease/exonuclease/phosphatase family protein [Gemmatimonadota bacterium]